MTASPIADIVRLTPLKGQPVGNEDYIKINFGLSPSEAMDAWQRSPLLPESRCWAALVCLCHFLP
jgi:hypothetical protein